MEDHITAFMAQKILSDNSRKAYQYDLKQFVELVSGDVTSKGLTAYKQFLADLQPTAQRRKLSSVNQFLYYLYQEGVVADFHKLTLPTAQSSSLPTQSQSKALLDWSCLYQGSDDSYGRFIAILIFELGLLPSEIISLKVRAVDTAFRVLHVSHRQLVRVLPLSERLCTALTPYLTGTYVLEHSGKPYTRQWLSSQLRSYLSRIGRSEMTAQALREQFILNKVGEGLSMMDLARQLGLKTVATLEKYYQVDGY